MNISDYFKKEMIVIEEGGTSSSELLLSITNKLYENNYVTAGFGGALLKREKAYPTGLRTIPFEVAIPHTDPEYVVQPCIFVAKLNKSVEFVEMATEDSVVNAKFVFVLVLKEGREQVHMLQQLLDFITDECKMKKLDKAESVEEIYSVLMNIN